jgi:multiple sugar transport system permease protein
MRTRSFVLFVAPSLVMMALFIAAPLVSVLVQSVHQTRTVFQDTVVESCTPGFLAPTCVRETRRIPVLGADGRPVTETVPVGFEAYRRLLEPDRVMAAPVWRRSSRSTSTGRCGSPWSSPWRRCRW